MQRQAVNPMFGIIKIVFISIFFEKEAFKSAIFYQ